MPLITSLIPTIMREMEPVGGNWCWISSTRSDLRYGMTHGWRFFIIFITIIIYIYIWIYLRRHLGPRDKKTRPTISFSTHNTNSVFSKGSKEMGFRVMREDTLELDTFGTFEPNISPNSPTMFDQRRSFWNTLQRDKIEEIQDAGLETQGEKKASYGEEIGGPVRHRPTSSKRGSDLAYTRVANTEPLQEPHSSRQPYTNVLQTNASEFPQRRGTRDVEVEIKRMMLLNGYPFMYVLLWTPGLVNRLLEALAIPVSETTIAALNTSTQFIGFANAATYGFNHYLRDSLDTLYWTPMIMRIKQWFGR
ncbi:hypothetical protein SNK03_009510 [Fusarium graminearum]